MFRSKFNTELNPFSEDYEKNALMQKSIHDQLIEDLAQFVIRKKPTCLTQPIRILDLCCGDGGATAKVLSAFTKTGIQVENIVGLDISAALIEKAKRHSKDDERLRFEVQNIEQMNYQQDFDLVLSFFGLHWVEDLHALAIKVAQALKPNGLMDFLVPLEKNTFLSLRKQVVQSPAWQKAFADFKLQGFIDQPLPYLQAFSGFFSFENKEGISGDLMLTYSEEQFKTFLSSWMQEVRHLQGGEMKEAYLKDLLMQVSAEGKEEKEPEVTSVQTKLGTYIQFNERVFWLHGELSNECGMSSG